MLTRPRLLALALAPGLVALLLAAASLTDFAHARDGSMCPGRVYKAAWQPEDLIFSGERAPGEAEGLRAECRLGARATVRDARRTTIIGAGLLLLAGVTIGVASQRNDGQSEHG